jgi:hypothetical protein
MSRQGMNPESSVTASYLFCGIKQLSYLLCRNVTCQLYTRTQTRTRTDVLYEKCKEIPVKNSEELQIENIVTCVTIDGVWIREWIYRPLIHTTRNYK